MRQNQPRGALRRKDRERMGLKGKNNRTTIAGLGILNHPLQQGLVAQVNTVEVPQGQDRLGKRNISILYMTKNLHGY
jgi:hypothetical protein